MIPKHLVTQAQEVKPPEAPVLPEPQVEETPIDFSEIVKGLDNIKTELANNNSKETVKLLADNLLRTVKLLPDMLQAERNKSEMLEKTLAQVLQAQQKDRAMIAELLGRKGMDYTDHLNEIAKNTKQEAGPQEWKHKVTYNSNGLISEVVSSKTK